MASRKGAPITAISAAPVITRCSCSTNSAMSSGAPCDLGMCTAPTAGARCSNQSSRATGSASISGGDAAFANPEIYEFLEAEGIGYTIRLPANRVLQDKIGYLLKRPLGRPPHEVRRFYASFGYQAQSWKKPRQVVAKVEWHPRGALSPRRLYRQQPGTAGGACRRLL
jgi:hypothetical protein